MPLVTRWAQLEIGRRAQEEPASFVKVIASLMPRELLMQVNVGFASMSVEELVATIRAEQGDKAAALLQRLIDDDVEEAEPAGS